MTWGVSTQEVATHVITIRRSDVTGFKYVATCRCGRWEACSNSRDKLESLGQRHAGG